MIPANYSKAVNSPDLNKWILTMRREFGSLIENNTFEWQKTLKNKNIIGSRCLFFFTIKSKSDRSHESKAYFVAKGYSQMYGKEYRETFTPNNKYGFYKITTANSSLV